VNFPTRHTLPEAEIMGLSDGEEIMTLAVCFRFDTIPDVTDRQTPRHVALAKTRATHCVARVKTKYDKPVGDMVRSLIVASPL